MSEIITTIGRANQLSRSFLMNLQDQIREVYRSDDRPWVIGYSGGKDSTTALQLIWSALKGLPQSDLKKQVYVISSDTLVETPMIVDFVDRTLDQINQSAKTQGLPITSHKVVPTTDDSFWVNLLGRGYPVPSNQFRWCTERLKISPADAAKCGVFGRVALCEEPCVVGRLSSLFRRGPL